LPNKKSNMSEIYIYNTLSHKKEVFKPLKDKKVLLYTCGPTVYWFAHIGNLRSYIFSDVLARVFRYNGYKVKHVMNITDVDDKTIKGTIKEYGKKAKKEELRKFAQKYIKVFKEDIRKLNFQKELAFVRATNVVEEIKTAVKKLIKKNFAYIKEGSAYFDIRKYNQKFNDYGILAGKDFLKGLKLGKVISVDEYQKENIGDFVLWKKFKKGEDANIFWTDPILGKGRPGWHIECSVISMEYLGKSIDIHNGGVDLIFPHHSNEIAQSQALSNKVPFVRYWLHAEHMLINNEKMAKSKNNFYTLRDIEKRFDPPAYRYLCLGSHYRSKMNFSWESLESGQNALKNLYQKTLELKKNGKAKRIGPKAKHYKDQFTKLINEDLNTPKALGEVWKMLDDKDISDKEKYALLIDFDKVLGLSLDKVKKEKIPTEVLKLVEQRERLRKQKEWKKSDQVRRKIQDKGFQVEDTKKGPEIRPL